MDTRAEAIIMDFQPQVQQAVAAEAVLFLGHLIAAAAVMAEAE
jgi:hypothetical protein